MKEKLTMSQCTAFQALATEVKHLVQQGFRWPDMRRFHWLRQDWPTDDYMIKQYVRLCRRIREAHEADPKKWSKVQSYQVHAVVVSVPSLTMGKFIV